MEEPDIESVEVEPILSSKHQLISEVQEPEIPPEEAPSRNLELPYRERSLWTRHLRDACVDIPLSAGPEHVYSPHTFAPPKNTGPWEDFTPVFIEQAQLYALVDKYGIEHRIT